MNARNVARLLWTLLRAAPQAAAWQWLRERCWPACRAAMARRRTVRPRSRRRRASPSARRSRSVITEWDDYSGRFAALENVEVRARVGGFLNSVHFRDGEMVRKGQLLFVIDPRPFEAALAQAQGQLEQARSQVVLSERSLARAGELRAQKMVSEQLYDERRAIAGSGPGGRGHGRSGAAAERRWISSSPEWWRRRPGASAGTWSASAIS